MNNRSLLPSAICSLIGDQGLVTSGGGLDVWQDQSGCGCDATPLAGQCVIAPNFLNGKSVIQLGPCFKLPVLQSKEYSFFAVIRPGNVENPYGAFLGANSAPGARWGLADGRDGTAGAGWGGDQGNINLGNTDYINPNEWKLITYIKSETEWVISCNSQFVRSVNDVSYPTYSGSHDWCLGKEVIVSDSNVFQGHIAELLICEEAFKNGQRKKVEKEIMSYWGL